MSYSWVKYCIVALNGVIHMVYKVNIDNAISLNHWSQWRQTQQNLPYFFICFQCTEIISHRYRLNNFFLHILTMKLKEILIYPFLSRALYFVRVTEINSIWLEFAVVNLYCCWASNFNLNDSGIDGGGGRGSLKTTYIDLNENKNFELEIVYGVRFIILFQ